LRWWRAVSITRRKNRVGDFLVRARRLFNPSLDLAKELDLRIRTLLAPVEALWTLPNTAV